MNRTPKLREKAGQLRALAAEQGVFFVSAEAEEIIAGSVESIAAQLGVSARWALDRYMTEQHIRNLVTQVVAASTSYRAAADAAEPVTLTVFEAARVTAALGMVLKLAADHAETNQAEALGIIHDGADAIVGISTAVTAAQPAHQLNVGGQDLVWARKVLNHAISLIDTGEWECSCEPAHGPSRDCALSRTLAVVPHRPV